jgi:hypothetical protein
MTLSKAIGSLPGRGGTLDAMYFVTQKVMKQLERAHPGRFDSPNGAIDSHSIGISKCKDTFRR